MQKNVKSVLGIVAIGAVAVVGYVLGRKSLEYLPDDDFEEDDWDDWGDDEYDGEDLEDRVSSLERRLEGFEKGISEEEEAAMEADMEECFGIDVKDEGPLWADSVTSEEDCDDYGEYDDPSDEDYDEDFEQESTEGYEDFEDADCPAPPSEGFDEEETEAVDTVDEDSEVDVDDESHE